MITPEMYAMADQHDWVWVRVEHIMNTIEDSADMGGILGYDGEAYQKWMDGDIDDDVRTTMLKRMITTKSADPCFGTLVESIIENGWQSAIGWNEDSAYLGNGHHRFVAAILLCEEWIPTTRRGSIWSTQHGEMEWDMEDEDDETQIVSWGYAHYNELYVEV